MHIEGPNKHRFEQQPMNNGSRLWTNQVIVNPPRRTEIIKSAVDQSSTIYSPPQCYSQHRRTHMRRISYENYAQLQSPQSDQISVVSGPAVLIPAVYQSTAAVVEDLSGDEEAVHAAPMLLPIMEGRLSKWTNLLHGWQERYFVLAEGYLSYYKSKEESLYGGCRGSLRLGKALVRPHEYDECRLDVGVGESIWFLRCTDLEERNHWIQALELHRIVDCDSMNEDPLQCSIAAPPAINTCALTHVSSTASASITSASSFQRGHRLKTKLMEMETFREILCRQVDTLQTFFDHCDRITRQGSAQLPITAETSSNQSEELEQRTHSSSCDDSLQDTQLDEDLMVAVEDSQSADLLSFDEDPDCAPINTAPIESGGGGFLSRLFSRSTNQSAATEAVKSTAINYSDLERLMRQNGAKTPDFKGEAITFKATTAGILATMAICMDLMQQSEQNWRHQLEREKEKNRRQDEVYKQRLTQLTEQLKRESALVAQLRRENAVKLRMPGPDYEEGPHCGVDEDEFFDALDAQLDRIERDDQLQDALRQSRIPHTLSSPEAECKRQALMSRIHKGVAEHLVLCDPTARVFSAEDGWMEIAKDGEMRMYKREMESADGKVLDPLQAVHTIDGITARELCGYFWRVEHRLEWEFTIEQPPTVLEVLEDCTVVLHQVYRRVWPATQRDAVFFSHMTRIDVHQLAQCCSAVHSLDEDLTTAPLPDNQLDYWMVLNCSTDIEETSAEGTPIAASIQRLSEQMVRLRLDVVMIGQTLRRRADLPLSRDNVCCRLLYAANIDPGGWAPASVLRKIAQREYPRFVKQFSQYVVDKTRDKDLQM